MEEEKKEKVKVDKLNKKSRIITVLLYISLFCVFSILLFVIFKKNELDDYVSCGTQNSEVNVKEIKTKLEDLNKKSREFVSEKMSKSEFAEKAKEFYTKEMIDILLQYYVEDEGYKNVCISMAGCNVEGGYMTDDADRGHFFFEINKINGNTVEATGYYGEFTTSINEVEKIIDNLSKQDITYKFENGNWKIAKFDIKAYN